MTLPTVSVSTVPYCGACGFEVSPQHQLAPANLCDACGADLHAYGFEGLVPPEGLAAAGGSLEVVFTFTANADADSTSLGYTIDGGEETVLTEQTSPVTVVAAEDEFVCARVWSVTGGVAGPSTGAECDTATA